MDAPSTPLGHTARSRVRPIQAFITLLGGGVLWPSPLYCEAARRSVEFFASDRSMGGSVLGSLMLRQSTLGHC